MNEQPQELGTLRTVAGPTFASGQQAPAEREILVRRVGRDGRHVATLRCIERAGQHVVEAEVYPLNTMRVEPLRLGPHAFASRQDAERFVEEASLAFEYLGCQLS